jgi:uncharacterized protein
MDRYTVNLSDILTEHGGSLAVTDEIQLDRLEVGAESFTFTEPVRFFVNFTETGAGVVATGTAEGTVEAECSRCLVHFELPLAGEVEGFYVTPAHAAGLPEEQPYELITDGKVDLLSALLQALTVEAPFAPVCKDDCKGICPTCGADRNVEECGCEPEPEPTPFDKLKGLLEEGE